MHTFRFNPVFEQWVLLGNSVPFSVSVSAKHILDVGNQHDFMAATFPRQPFILDPDALKSKKPYADRLYMDNPAVGEYELLLYKGSKPLWNWDVKLWNNWLSLVQHRLIQAHHNPHLHYCHLSIHTDGLQSIEDFQRVGDLVLTSHPICGYSPVLTADLADKLAEKESLYVLFEDGFGCIQVPSAPTEHREVWYVPKRHALGVESITKDERLATARSLHKVMGTLHDEFPEDQYVITMYTNLAASAAEYVWWVRIYKKTSEMNMITIKPFPEGFAHKLSLNRKM